MKPLDVVLLQSEAGARSLTPSLGHYFRAVHVAHSVEELRKIIVKQDAPVAIVDMEMVGLSEVEKLNHDFGGICVVCTHRLADEEMWTEALDAGAADVCSSTDTGSIVAAAMRYAPISRSVAA
jgi:DNA-binding NarL/FixJ family response regulator